MAKLKISLKGDNLGPGNHRYSNEVNSENFREISKVLADLKNFGLPIDKAIKDLKNNQRSAWDDIIGCSI